MKIKKGNLLIGFIQVISIIIIIISLYYIYLWYIDNKKTENILNEIYENANVSSDNISVDNDLKIEVENIDFNKLINKNPDTIGWIKVLGTDINYPVVQTNNNDFYLTHSFDKSYNKAGWIFADYINKNLKNNELDKNTIIYGHNRQNNSMFGTLSNVFKEEWLSNKENHYINFSTLNNNMVWEVFSTYTIEKEEYYIQSNFSSDEEYISFLNTIKNRSTYKYDVNISKEDKILTLSTCTNVGKGRTVLHAKLIYRK
ncbi:MAG TPA: class B sortase [Clostridiaceae bacterium]|nr:class B sortase [Clostridia bacterium]CDC06151.1 srtB family sortase [Clostridium sp. CAG:343]HCF33965.1 SrtB family sortase [Clostridiales bacterium]HJJ19142.1 class B sortase [Clostridiaceae bacterium]